MKRGQPLILYFGSDQEFLKKLKECCQNKVSTPVDVFEKKYTPKFLLETCLGRTPNIVFIDFTAPDTDFQALAEELAFIKRNGPFKKIFFAALFEDMAQRKQHAYLFSCGIQYSFIKGQEEENLFNDCLHIGLNERLKLAKYARARNIAQNLQVGMVSSLTALGDRNFLVETDLSTEYDTLDLELSFFEELKANQFKIKAHYLRPLLHPMTETYVCELPYAGPWDQASDKNLQKETVETWRDFHREELKLERCNVKIYSNQFHLLSKLYECTQKYSFFADMSDQFGVDEAKLLIQGLAPQVIILDLLGPEEDPTVHLSTLIQQILPCEGLRPIIVITGMPSTSEALRKFFNYQNLVAMPQRLCLNSLEVLLSKLSEKKSATADNYLYFPFSDTRKTIDVFFDVTVSALTEHEITFFCKSELPMFTVLHFELPLDFYVVVIPSLVEVEPTSKGIFHLGLIHGLDEEGLKLMRKFVNQIIYRPIQKFTEEEVAKILAQKEEKVTPTGALDKANEEKNMKVKDEFPKEQKYEVIRKKYKKSKL